MSVVYDIPRLGEPFALRGRRDVALVLDEFTPTHLDAWLGRAVYGDVAARVLAVRHAGDLVGSRRTWGRGGRRLREVFECDPPATPLLGVVVEQSATAVLWLPDREPARLAVELSRRDWRDHL